MALLAIVTECLLVHVVLCMTVIALAAGVPETSIQVTGLAAYDTVLANEWEHCQLMIKAYILQPPAFVAVALAAGFTQLPLMDIVLLVATEAAGIQFLFIQITGMTGLA